MSKLTGKWISDGAIASNHLASSAKQAVLESKLTATRRGVLTFNASAASSDDVSTPVLAAALTDSPTSDLATLGIYAGTVSGATDVKKVLIRLAGTDQGVPDGNSDEVYGVMSESSGVYTLSYKKADGTAFTFGGATDIDFYFVEVYDLFSLPADASLYQAVSGVVDATSVTTLAGHLNGIGTKHNGSEIHISGSGSYYAAGTLEAALASIDAQVSTNTSGVAAVVDDVSHLVTLSGVAVDSINLGTFTGSTIADNRTIKQALQDLETAHEVTDTKVGNLVTLSGVAANATDLGTFTGSTIPDSQTIKQALQALETALEAISSEHEAVEYFTLSGTDITNKYLPDLAHLPKAASNVRMFIKSAPNQFYGDDFTVITNGTDVRRVNWNGLGLDGVLASGDKLTIVYTY